MTVVVTGSIATDYLMSFPGRFADQFVDGQLDKISLSFLVEDLEIRRGGVAANIAFGLGCLGERPLLVGAVGSDFAEYRSWLERHGVDTSGVHVSELRHTSRFQCTTDRDMNQIASFYAGAMTEAREIELAGVLDGLDTPDIVLVGANDPAAMVRHSQECRDRGYPFAADFSQQVAFMEGPDLRALVEGATYLFTNAYERSLLEQKTGWSSAELLARVGTAVATQGEKGVLVERAGEPVLAVAAGNPRAVVEPTGVGDAFRAGFLAGISWRLGDERAAQVGCVLATLVLETVGPQEYTFDAADFLARITDAYGPAAAADVAPHLGG
ncbi:MAG TPA: carbohydrate kinase family protein [Pseudonocardia sp.]|jgi:adenosine kinase|nr:carbohydrate kinase family protein [Pseudonocardia sp.]